MHSMSTLDSVSSVQRVANAIKTNSRKGHDSSGSNDSLQSAASASRAGAFREASAADASGGEPTAQRFDYLIGNHFGMHSLVPSHRLPELAKILYTARDGAAICVGGLVGLPET